MTASEITAAENRIVEILEVAYGGNPAPTTDVMRHVSYRHPATVAYAALWALIRDERLVREDGRVRLSHV